MEGIMNYLHRFARNFERMEAALTVLSIIFAGIHWIYNESKV